MKKTRKNSVEIAMLLMSSIAIFFASCEKEVLGGMSGDIRVNFTIGDLSYEEGKSGVRSDKPLVSETVEVPVSDDIIMFATLEENENLLRTPVPMAEGTRLRIVAYQSSTQRGYAEYQVVAGGGIEPVGAGLSVPSTGKYDFVAYSYNTTTAMPTYSASINALSSDNDLLWGKTLNETIVAGTNNVTIKMYHQFSQIKMKITTEALPETENITAITARVGPCYNASFNVNTGGMSKGTTSTPSVNLVWDGLGTQVITSTRCVYTYGESAYMDFVFVTMNGVQYNRIPLFYFSAPLALGHSYSVTITFTRTNVLWAGSNIYWTTADGGKLTFDAPAAVDAASQLKQGVLFKWGSLIGISPAYGTGDDAAYSSTTPVYVPYFNSSSNKGWTTYVSGSSPDWTDILPVTDDVPDRRDVSYLGNDARNTGSDYAYWKAKKGDICRYISENGYGPGGNYRMPTSFEFGMKAQYGYNEAGWSRTGTPLALSTEGADGQRSMGGGMANSRGSVTFTQSGLRWHDTGELRISDNQYLSGSGYETFGGYVLQFGSYIYVHVGLNRRFANPVRCVKTS
jgi:hypothetical protein